MSVISYSTIEAYVQAAGSPNAEGILFIGIITGGQRWILHLDLFESFAELPPHLRDSLYKCAWQPTGFTTVEKGTADWLVEKCRRMIVSSKERTDDPMQTFTLEQFLRPKQLDTLMIVDPKRLVIKKEDIFYRWAFKLREKTNVPLLCADPEEWYVRASDLKAVAEDDGSHLNRFPHKVEFVSKPGILYYFKPYHSGRGRYFQRELSDLVKIKSQYQRTENTLRVPWLAGIVLSDEDVAQGLLLKWVNHVGSMTTTDVLKFGAMRLKTWLQQMASVISKLHDLGMQIERFREGDILIDESDGIRLASFENVPESPSIYSQLIPVDKEKDIKRWETFFRELLEGRGASSDLLNHVFQNT